MPVVSILICSNKPAGSLDHLFSSMAGQKFLEKCEVVFVDNRIGSDGKEIGRRLSSLNCKATYILEKKPGIWAARKTSYENARGEWLLTLDDDNSLGEGTLENLFMFISAHPEVGGICPRIVADWEVIPPGWLQSFGRLYCLSYTESGKYGPGVGETVWKPGEPGGLNPPGGGSIVRREAAEAFLKSDRIPCSLRNSRLGSEDFAMYSFAHRLGYHTAYVPSVVVYHRIPRERLKMAYLTKLNLRMAYAYGQLEHSWRRLTLKNIAGSVCRYGKWSFASSPVHPWAYWLNLVRTAGFAGGLLRTRFFG